MTLNRRHFGMSMIAAAGRAAFAAPGLPSILVVHGDRAPAFEEAAAGLRADLAGSAELKWLDLETHDGGMLPPSALTVTLGTRAAAFAGAFGSSPILAAMVLDADSARAALGVNASRVSSYLTLDPPPQQVLSRVRMLFPRRRRMAIMGRCASRMTRSSIQAAAQALSFEVEFFHCPTTRHLLDALDDARLRSEILWCLPDAELYPPAAVNTIAITAIRARLPLVGFSEGFVRAGAMLGVFPDYRDIGAQTGWIARRLLGGQPVGQVEPPRTLRAGINEKVLRTTGVEIAAGWRKEGVAVIQ